MRGKITIIQGAQYGSEGKGMIAAMEASDPNYASAVRTGGPNSGHTVIFKDRHIVMNQIPTAWIHPHCKLVLGPGAIIKPSILQKEIETIREAGMDVDGRLYIHPNAAVIRQEDKESSDKSGRYYTLGGTSEGSSGAVCRRIARDFTSPSTVFQMTTAYPWMAKYVMDTTQLLENDLKDGGDVLIEGTQGCHLDMLLGPYPYTTHRGCNTSMLLAEAGLAPTNNIEVGLVARTYPIRVAGNSGGMPNEISWMDMLRKLKVSETVVKEFESEIIRELVKMDAPANPNMHKWHVMDKEANTRAMRVAITHALHQLDYPELEKVEKTSVTNLVRRIAEFSTPTVDKSRVWSGCTWLAMTFTNYVDPELEGQSVGALRNSADFRLWMMENDLPQWIRSNGVRLRWANTGPKTSHHHRIDNAMFDI